MIKGKLEVFNRKTIDTPQVVCPSLFAKKTISGLIIMNKLTQRGPFYIMVQQFLADLEIKVSLVWVLIPKT